MKYYNLFNGELLVAIGTTNMFMLNIKDDHQKVANLEGDKNLESRQMVENIGTHLTKEEFESKFDTSTSIHCANKMYYCLDIEFKKTEQPRFDLHKGPKEPNIHSDEYWQSQEGKARMAKDYEDSI